MHVRMHLDRPAKAAVICAFALSVAAAAGCGSSGDEPSTSSQAAQGGATETTSTQTSAGSTGSAGAIQPDPQLQALLPAAVKSKGQLTIATAPTEVPLEFYDKSHKLVGAEVDMGNALGQLLGLDIKWVPVGFDSIIPGLQAGRFDVGLSGFADRAEREKVVDFVVFYKTGRAFVAKADTDPGVQDVDDLCGKDIGLEAGTTMVEQATAQSRACTDAGEPAVKIHTFPDANSVILSIESGRTPFTMLPDISAIGAVQQSNGRLHIVGAATGGNDNNGMAISKESGLTPVMQKAIQALADKGYLKETYRKWGLKPEILYPQVTVNSPFEE
jgi:polar amino acid transport system substrate-binding protein